MRVQEITKEIRIGSVKKNFCISWVSMDLKFENEVESILEEFSLEI